MKSRFRSSFERGCVGFASVAAALWLCGCDSGRSTPGLATAGSGDQVPPAQGGGGSAGLPLVNPQLPAPEGGPSEREPGSEVPSVCGFTAAVAYGPAAADGLMDVPPSEPNLHYMGRVDCTDPGAASFAYPAVSIRARFEGAAVDLRLRDHGLDGEDTANYYEVIIDGVRQTVRVSPTQEVYSLGRNLGPGPHDLEIWKRVESGPGGRPDQGRAEFLGLRLAAGSKLLPVVKKKRAIEFVGDSITCGYGNEISTTDPDSFKYTTKNSNAYLAYGAVTARALDAEYVAVAASGRGVSRNYGGFSGFLIPEAWKRTLPELASSPAWDIHRLSPDVVVVNLGTNDFSPPATDINRHAFQQNYVNFLAELRNAYPGALLVTALGPMMSDSYPPGILAWTAIQEDMGRVIATRKAAGDTKLVSIVFPPQSSPHGEDWHPTVATHQGMADRLVALLKQELGW